ncbi:MAG: type 1 glutamine amidotransferase [Candidatus Abyssobacteria bacterium SURF_17]|uniref:Type 1 glutamine amidotransferase n=1 Tax=Candidatus Abyssobacteria bacterium SURF_17 TaxID=2093361 RepID=A0A419EV21_9BACT|nr:MAG: type 1 glutamine amidotransferase [Candidatus Abyssubacteria bacterium SURF_17]
MGILIIDNGPYPRIIRQASWIRSYLPGIRTEIVYAIENRMPHEPEKYDGVILSGGIEPLFSERAWLLAELKLIEKCAEKSVPLLGICYGHQLIGRALMGPHAVREKHSPEFGWKQIRLVQHDSHLFEGIPSEFYAHCSHFDEVCELSPEFRLLAESDRCKIQAYEHVSNPIWGVQFHSEINVRKGRLLLILNGLANLRPSLATPRTLLEARDSGIAPKLFSNFLDFAMRR